MKIDENRDDETRKTVYPRVYLGSISGKTRIREKRLWMADVYKFMKQGTSIRWQKRRQKVYAMEIANKWECFHFDANTCVRRFESKKKDIAIDARDCWYFDDTHDTRRQRRAGKLKYSHDHRAIRSRWSWMIARKYERMHYIRHKYEKKLQYKKITIKCTSIKNR